MYGFGVLIAIVGSLYLVCKIGSDCYKADQQAKRDYKVLDDFNRRHGWK